MNANVVRVQDFVKALFADPEINKTHRLAAVNSINWARILAQITYYFASYFSLVRQTSQTSPEVQFIVPTGNFGDILAGYFAKRMGLPVAKLVIATNENDILHRFWKTGRYEKKPVHGREAEGGIVEDGVKAHEDGVKETLSPAMDILVSSNFERLLWFLAYEQAGSGDEARKAAGEKVKGWLNQLKSEGGFAVDEKLLTSAKRDFASERVSDKETISTIKEVYAWNAPKSESKYILDPHSAIGIAATLRNQASKETHHISLATAHPAKFSNAVELALKNESGFDFNKVLPEQFVGLDKLEKRVTDVKKSGGFEGIRTIVVKEVELELAGQR